MILVSGTKRSGVSLWMQVLLSAGHPGFGEAYAASATWETVDAARFHSSSFAEGIYFATNPNPRTGKYVFPEQVERHAVQVTPAGVVRTDRAFIRNVLVTMRPWREYVVAMESQHALEDATRSPHGVPARFTPALEWFAENYALIRDASMRRYATHFESFGRVQRDPERVIAEVLAWLGSGDVAKAVAAVRPEERRIEDSAASGLEPDAAAVCDELYALIDERRPVTAAFVTRLNELHGTLLPRLRDEEARVLADVRRRQGQSQP